MTDLDLRLAAINVDAGAALRVIAYFDALAEARAGLQPIVRGAAILADCPARLQDPYRRVRIRVTREGRSQWREEPPDASWMSVTAGTATLWLERPGPAGPVEAMLLERAAGAARAALERTRGRVPAPDPATARLIVDASAPEDVRLRAARRLGLLDTGYVIALDDEIRVLSGPLPPLSGRAGVGPATPLPQLPASWEAARVALRFAADGTDEDPGPRVVHAAELGGLALLAAAGDQSALPDARALEHAASAAPWMLTTLHAVASTMSLRAAATMLRVGYPTLHDRVTYAEQLLDWNVREPQGRLRLQLAMALRRLRRHP